MEHGPYTAERAAYDQARYLDGIVTDHVRELTLLRPQAQLHNFKYFTWVEQPKAEPPMSSKRVVEP